ncbi:MAG: hypothetical protein FJ045_05890 [Crenarchaeota archaeon]|nr:hypothetical protein [Thermoproteota archaeon]
MLWLANVQTSAKGETINLVKHLAFAETMAGRIALKPLENLTSENLSDFSNLILPAVKENPRALSQLWERMCDAKVKDSTADGVGRFIHALYRECAKNLS